MAIPGLISPTETSSISLATLWTGLKTLMTLVISHFDQAEAATRAASLPTTAIGLLLGLIGLDRQ